MDALSATTANEPARAATPGGSWRFAAADADAALRRPVRAALDELGVLAVTGEDAARFLHGQLTGDIEHLQHHRLALNGYCTAKGRLLATFRVWRDERAIYLLLPRELLAGVLKRLSMFVLRAKVRLTDDSAAWRIVAVFGNGAEAKLRETFGTMPESIGDCVRTAAVRVARLHGSARLPDRFLLLGAAGEASLPPSLSALPAVDSGAFWWSEIDAGVPTVFAATQERFVPQMINFEVLGGVSFSKGCYPGQEVVARSQYRGKLRRRLALAHAEAGADAGTDVYAEGEAEPAGTVAMAASAPGGGVDLLLECPLEKFTLRLHLGAPDGPALELRPLPYELIDVTA